jgi:hypothetical protein
MKIYIKNMVCQGTKKFVLMEIKKLGLNLKALESDFIEFQGELSPSEEFALGFRLGKYGLVTEREGNFPGYNPVYSSEPIAAEVV